MVQFVVLMFVSVLTASGAGADTPNTTIHLLTLVLLAETVGLSHQPPCQRGEELISAAQMAVNKINMGFPCLHNLIFTCMSLMFFLFFSGSLKSAYALHQVSYL